MANFTLKSAICTVLLRCMWKLRVLVVAIAGAIYEEQKILPMRITELSAEIKKLIDTVIKLNESALRQIESRIDELGRAMGKHELRLVE